MVWRLDIFERRRVFRDRQRRRRSREFAMHDSDRRGRAMMHDTVRRLALRRIDAPLLRGGGNDQRARDRTGALAERSVRRRAVAAARALSASTTPS